MSARLLELAAVSVRLSGTTILDDVSLRADAGEFIAVVGPNGAGKTTLLRVAGGLEPAAGRILIGGDPLAALRPTERARRVAYLPQGHVVHWPLPVADVVGLGRLPRGAGADLSADDRRAVTAAMAATGVTAFAERAVTTLSGGERARVVLARVLATETPLILADEPTAALDPRYQLAVIDILRRHADHGGAVVAVLHDLTLAARAADRIVLFAGGRVAADGPPRAVLSPDNLAATFGITSQVLDVGGHLVVAPLAAKGVPG
jgi:iron complex transport system ATP-binding protein